MQQTNVIALLPAKARRVIYIVYGLASLLSTAALAAYTALPASASPDWLVVALAVLGALAGPIGVLAASNTGAAEAPGPAPGTRPGPVPTTS